MNGHRILILFFLFAVLFCQHHVWGEDAEVLVAQGMEKIGSHDYQEAADLLSRAIEMDPDNPEANYYAGFAYSRVGEYEKAEQLLSRALELDPTAVEAYFELGLVYVSQADCTQAESFLLKFRNFSTDEGLKQIARNLLQDCKKEAPEEKRFRLTGTAGIQYDTNVILEQSNPPPNKNKKGDFRDAILFLSSGLTAFENDLVNVNLDYDGYFSDHVELDMFNRDPGCPG